MTQAISIPLVSVIIPAFNGERHIGAALDSVQGQTVDAARIELIVIDDGSTDATAAVVSRWPAARYQHQPNAGVAAARNHGVRCAAADVVMFLDQDDVWEPDKVRLQLDHLSANPAIGILGGRVRAFADSPVAAVPRQMRLLLESEQPSYLPSALAVRRAVFDQIGLFDPSFVLSSDGDWLIRARRGGIVFATLPQRVCRYRVHEDNASHDVIGMQRELLRAMRGSQTQKPL